MSTRAVTLVPMKKLSCLDIPVPGVQRHAVRLVVVSGTIRGRDSGKKNSMRLGNSMYCYSQNFFFVLLISDSL